jgi:hypothetical protein
MGMHLRAIGLHPLHSPPFVKVCFSFIHTLTLMGPCNSHLVMNSMLGLQQVVTNSELVHWYLVKYKFTKPFHLLVN